MIKKINRIVTIVTMMSGGAFLLSCESEADNLGYQLLNKNDVALIGDFTRDVIAYNIDNNDSLRADGRIAEAIRKDSIVLGAYQDDNFGKQNVSFVSQLRLSSYAPDFGENPIVDSVVLALRPKYNASEEVTTTYDENYKYQGNDAKMIKRTYPVYKYGNSNANMTIKVHAITNFLGSTSGVIYSNKVINEGEELASYSFNGGVSSVEITKDNDRAILYSSLPTIRIKLNNDFFTKNIINKKGSSDLANLANFIRYIKGLKISVDGDNGYLMKLGIPKKEDVTIYYTKNVVSDGKTKREQAKYTLKLSEDNPSFSSIKYDRTGSAWGNAKATINTTLGDPKIYLQGMGGANLGVKIKDETITELKEKYQKEKIGILSAKLRFYVDNTNDNSLSQPRTFTVATSQNKSDGTPLYNFLSDINVFANNGNYALVKSYNLGNKGAYYDIDVTNMLKNVVEKSAPNESLVVKLGNYLNSQKNLPAGYHRIVDNRIYSQQRVVLVGTNAGSTSGAKLIVDYSKK